MVGTGGARINAIPIDSWVLERAADGSATYRYASGGGDYLSFRASLPGGGWRSENSINGVKEVVQLSDGGSTVQISHTETGISGTGRYSKNTKKIVFDR